MPVSPGQRSPFYRFKLSDIDRDLAADYVQNEQLDGGITRVLEVELFDEVTLATNLQVELHQDERLFDTSNFQFRGHTNQISGTAYPNRVALTCVGPLARLRQCPSYNHNLTGMTDGQAVRHILNACNIDYDTSDIGTAGYVLGAIRPIYWQRDTPGAAMIAELDRVFGMATTEIEDGRVVRRTYDRAPDEADITQTYTINVDNEFWSTQRDRGDLDAITNLWEVTGLSWSTAKEDGGDGLTRTIWARGSADNPAFSSGDRNRAGSFQSEIIQSTALAVTIAKRMMRWYNRQPDEITIGVQNDVSVYPGRVIGVSDDAYGITLTAGADETPYLVLTCDRRGDEMTLHCVGGAAGSEGTITGGVEVTDNTTSDPGDVTPTDYEPVPDPTPGICVLNPADAEVPPNRSYGSMDIPAGTEWVWIHGNVTGATGNQLSFGVYGTGSSADQGYQFLTAGLKRWMLVPGTATEADSDAAYIDLPNVTGTIKVGDGGFETFYRIGTSGSVQTIPAVYLGSSSGDPFFVSDVCFEFLSSSDWPY